MVDFLVIGNVVAAHYSEIFPLLKEERVYLGYSISAGDRKFSVPEDYEFSGQKCGEDEEGRYVCVKGVRWFTSLFVEDKDYLVLSGSGDHQEFDNQKIINIDSVDDIPSDFYGEMGVPITFLDKWCRRQFEIVGIADNGSGGLDMFCPRIDGVGKFTRIIIRRK